MRVRGVLTACSVVLAFWGAVQSSGGIINHGLSTEAICNGSHMGPEDELGPTMNGDDRCFPSGGGDYRTYEQQLDYQRGKHQDVVVGAWCLGAGLVGVSPTRCLRRRSGCPALGRQSMTSEPRFCSSSVVRDCVAVGHWSDLEELALHFPRFAAGWGGPMQESSSSTVAGPVRTVQRWPSARGWGAGSGQARGRWLPPRGRSRRPAATESRPNRAPQHPSHPRTRGKQRVDRPVAGSGGSARAPHTRPSHPGRRHGSRPGIRGVHGKGGVEGQIGWVRRNQLVPVHEVDTLAELNAVITGGTRRTTAAASGPGPAPSASTSRPSSPCWQLGQKGVLARGQR